MKYEIYYDYENLSLLDSAISLCKKLNIDAIYNGGFEYFGGEWGALSDESTFLTAQAYNLSLANKNARDLLVLENLAYKNLILAKKSLDKNLPSNIESKLSAQNLAYNPQTNIISLSDLLLKNEVLNNGIFKHKKVDFENFSACIFSNDIKIKQICEKLGLKIRLQNALNFNKLQILNESLSFKYSAQMLESALDSASDFIITDSMDIFELMDKKRSKLNKSINRDLGRIPILFLPQLILCALGINDEHLLNFRFHCFVPDFL